MPLSIGENDPIRYHTGMKSGDFSWIGWDEEAINAAAVAALLSKRTALRTVKAVPADKRTFENTVAAMERSGEDANDVIQVLDLMVNVHPNAGIRAAAQAAVDRVNTELIGMEYDRALWTAFNEWLSTDEHDSLAGADLKLADDIHRDMRRMGFGLDDNQFARLKKLTEELKKLENDFGKAINDWDDHIVVPHARLGGLPQRYIDGLRKTDAGQYSVSLRYPDLFPFMELADDDAGRKELAHKNFRKGGEENLERLVHMIQLRQEIAGLLGYQTHADYAEEVRMSRTAGAVRQFLERIIEALKPVAHKELAELVAYKFHTQKAEKPSPITFYEIAYWAYKMKKELFDLDMERVKEYFPLQTVTNGMLEMYQELLGLKFSPANLPVWHPDVKSYMVAEATSGALLGYFFLDLYPREGKYGHAAAFPITLGPTPAVALVCNFPKPTDSSPSLLSHGEVETFLHEFGHCVHALVSGQKWQRQNGFGVPLDFIEALSQIFEYWAWDERSLMRLSGHYKTGAPLPPDLLKKLLGARTYRQTSSFLRQAVLALYDLDMHDRSTDSPVRADVLAQTYRDMRLTYEHIDLPDDAIFAAGWSHMADYDAGYYGYLWSKVYAADMFTRFASNPLDRAIGRSYRTDVLAPGASRPEEDVVRAFLGRDHSPQAFLTELGIG